MPCTLCPAHPTLSTFLKTTTPSFPTFHKNSHCRDSNPTIQSSTMFCCVLGCSAESNFTISACSSIHFKLEAAATIINAHNRCNGLDRSILQPTTQHDCKNYISCVCNARSKWMPKKMIIVGMKQQHCVLAAPNIISWRITAVTSVPASTVLQRCGR